MIWNGSTFLKVSLIKQTKSLDIIRKKTFPKVYHTYKLEPQTPHQADTHNQQVLRFPGFMEKIRFRGKVLQALKVYISSNNTTSNVVSV